MMISRFPISAPPRAEKNTVWILLSTLSRLLLLLWLPALVVGCACPRQIQVHFYDEVKDGYASGVDGDLIRVLVDGKLLPGDAFGIEEITGLAEKHNPQLPAKEYNVTFGRAILTGASDQRVFIFISDLAGNLSVFRYQPEGRCGWRSTTLSEEEADSLWRKYVPQGLPGYPGTN